MADKEIVRWITVRGVHIPLYKGDTPQTATTRFLKENSAKRQSEKQDQIEKRKKEADKLNAEEQLRDELKSNPKINEFGKDGSITMTYVRIKNQGTQHHGAKYGQNIEPAGEYMQMDTMKGTAKVDSPNYEYGKIHFNKPLILEHKSTDDKGWKRDLSNMYGGKTGKALSSAIKKDGYDAVMTWEKRKGKREWSEIVNLTGRKG